MYSVPIYATVETSPDYKLDRAPWSLRNRMQGAMNSTIKLAALGTYMHTSSRNLIDAAEL